MNVISKISFILLLSLSYVTASAQQFVLGFSDPTVNCTSMEVCYDVTLASDGVDFGLGDYNLRLFYDASRVNYVPNSPNLASLPTTYLIGTVINDINDLSGLGSLSFESSLGFLEIPVGYSSSTPAMVVSTPINVLQNLCFTLVDDTILNDDASCFDLIWVREDNRELYASSVTTLQNAGTGVIDYENSTYNDLTSASNCLANACDTSPDLATFELDFTAGTLDCEAQTICYDITIASLDGFDLGSCNLRLFYDADLLDLIDTSPNTSPGSSLDASYGISMVDDFQGGDQSLNGSLPFDDNIDYIAIALDYLGANPIVVGAAAQTITHDLCFNILDMSLITDPTVCIHTVWSTNASKELYANGETTVNIAGIPAITADIDGSTYNNLEPTGDQCLVNACVTNPDLATFELDFTAGTLDCQAQTICYDITIASPDDFELGSCNLRLFYDADLLDLIDTSPNTSPGSSLNASYGISSVDDFQGGDQSLNGSLPFDDNIDYIDIALDYLGANPIVVGAAAQTITHDLCFNILDRSLVVDPTVCIHAVWSTNASKELYANGETTVNIAGTPAITADIDGSIYNNLEPTGDQCLVNACLPDSDIPTMGEWGLICLSLILLIFGVVAIKEKSLVLSQG